MIRAFFAIELPLETQAAITESLIGFKLHYQNAIRWIKPSNFHITLQFLKHLDPNDILKLSQLVKEEIKPIKAFTLQLHLIELFPTSHRPRYLSLQVGPDEILSRLSKTIGEAMKKLNYPTDNRVFRGHLSLGKVIHSHELPAFPTILFPEIHTKINDIVLFQSEPSFQGSQYTPLTRISL